MSHSLNVGPKASGNLVAITAEILDYPAGGESFSLSELGAALFPLPSNQNIFCFQAIGPNQNSLGVPLIVTLDTALSALSIRVVLWQVTSTGLAQIAATTGLNATFSMCVRGS